MYILNILIIMILSAMSVLSIAGEKQELEGKHKLFGRYHFEKGGYILVGKRWDGPRSDLTERLGDFYTDDVRVLKKIRQKWIVGKQISCQSCGYQYGIFVLHNGEIVERYLANLDKECSVISVKKRHYWFNPEILEQFKEEFKPIYLEKKHFISADEGRKYIKMIKNNSGLLMFFEPKWLEFDGEFRYKYRCSYKPLNGEEKKCIQKAKDELSCSFPGEPFDVELGGLMNGEILVKVKSRKSLYDSFKMYPIVWEWREYSPVLSIAWKSNYNPDFQKQTSDGQKQTCTDSNKAK